MDPSSRLPQVANRGVATGPIIALVLVSAIGNVVGTFYFWEISYRPFDQFIWCIGLGLMVAQPCALAVWCALGTQKLVVRVPLTMGILFCLVCEYVGTLYALDNSMPLEITFILIVGTFVLAAFIQVPLWIFRLKTRHEISLMGEERKSAEDSQFGIKHLLITTTIAAVVAAVFQYTFKTGKFDGGAPWAEIIGFLVAFELFISVITLLCVAFVYSRASRTGIGVLLALVVMVGPFGVRSFVNAVTTGFMDPNMLLNVFGFAISLTTALTVVLFAFHSMGYRMQRVSS